MMSAEQIEVFFLDKQLFIPLFSECKNDLLQTVRSLYSQTVLDTIWFHFISSVL